MTHKLLCSLCSCAYFVSIPPLVLFPWALHLCYETKSRAVVNYLRMYFYSIRPVSKNSYGTNTINNHLMFKWEKPKK